MRLHGNIYARIVNIFIILTVLIILIIVHFSLATATIFLPQSTEKFIFDGPMEITVAEQPTWFEANNSVELVQSKTVQVLAKTTKTDKASAVVKIINTYSKSQSLVKTTRFLSVDNKLFRLSQTVTVPAGGSVQAIIEADQPGESFIIPAGKFTIPGLWAGLQDKIYGQTDAVTSFERPNLQIISQQDFDQAVNDLAKTLPDKALPDLIKKTNNQNLTANDLLVTITKSSAKPAVGTEAGSFTVDLTANVRAVPIDQQFLRQKAEDALKARLPENISVVNFLPDNYDYEITSLDQTKGTMIVQVHLEALVSSSNTAEINLADLQGKTKTEAEQILSTQGYQDVRIELWPFWVTHVPILTDHIQIASS